MIGNTRLHEVLRRHRLMSEAVVWLEVFTTQLKTQVIDWIREDQLKKKGIDADGDVLGYYSPVTELITRGRKKANTHYTLDDTGEFYRSIFVTVLKGAIEIDGKTDKFEDQDWFTTRILNLTDENLGKLIEEVKKRYIAIFRQILFKN